MDYEATIGKLFTYVNTNSKDFCKGSAGFEKQALYSFKQSSQIGWPLLVSCGFDRMIFGLQAKAASHMGMGLTLLHRAASYAWTGAKGNGTRL